MALDFYTVYVLTAKDFQPQVVFGAHEHQEYMQGQLRPVTRVLMTNSRRPVGILPGEVTEVDPKTFEIQTDAVLFKLEYLTVEKFRELGEAGAIIGWQRLASKFSTDGDVQQFYIHEFLMDYPWYIEEARTS